jgi:peptidoglycan/LPS O-acetylase OafA/YrhL
MQIRSLTGIRGVAALWVVIYHVHERDDLHGVIIKTLLTHGYLAVDLFFLLSGFVMAISYGRFATAGWDLASYGTFLRHRFARVYPLYFLVTCSVAAMIVLGVSKAHTVGALGRAFLPDLVLMDVWFSLPSIAGPSWSISTEFTAYVLFPVLAAGTLTMRRPGVIVVVAALCIATIYLLQFSPMPPGMVRMGPLDIYGGVAAVLRCVSEFTLGLVAYRLTKNERVVGWAGRPAVPAAVAALLLVLLCVPGMDVFAVLAMAPLLIVLTLSDRGLSPLLGSPVVFFLGEISYAIYLLHVHMLRLRRIGENEWIVAKLGAVGADALALLTLYGALIVCSWLTYRMIERPCRNWFRTAGAKRQGRQDPAPLFRAPAPVPVADSPGPARARSS